MQDRLVGFFDFVTTVQDVGRKASISVMRFFPCWNNCKRKGSTTRNPNRIVLLLASLLRFDRTIIGSMRYEREELVAKGGMLSFQRCCCFHSKRESRQKDGCCLACRKMIINYFEGKAWGKFWPREVPRIYRRDNMPKVVLVVFLISPWEEKKFTYTFSKENRNSTREKASSDRGWRTFFTTTSISRDHYYPALFSRLLLSHAFY